MTKLPVVPRGSRINFKMQGGPHNALRPLKTLHSLAVHFLRWVMSCTYFKTWNNQTTQDGLHQLVPKSGIGTCKLLHLSHTTTIFLFRSNGIISLFLCLDSKHTHQVAWPFKKGWLEIYFWPRDYVMGLYHDYRNQIPDSKFRPLK